MANDCADICLNEHDLKKCPPEVIVEAGNEGIHSDRKYVQYLSENGIKIGSLVAWSLRISEIIGTKHIATLIVVVLALSAGAGVLFGCNSVINCFCSRSVFLETKTYSGDLSSSRAWTSVPPTGAGDLEDPNGVAPTSARSTTTSVSGSDRVQVERRQTDGSFFNLSVFQASIIVFAFVLAFSRWMIENRQSAMSEIFDRKKEVNLLLLKDEKGVFQPLISEAVRPDTGPTIERHVIKDGEVERLLRCAATKPTVNGKSNGKTAISDMFRNPKRTDKEPENAEFLRQMFVYIELDNFELAFNRYIAGLLDPEQMYRACEIIESRCLNPTFRYMAAAQGIKYYTDKFHRALIYILVRAQYVDDLVHSRNGDAAVHG